jgi:excisionase family DNA binding protein
LIPRVIAALEVFLAMAEHEGAGPITEALFEAAFGERALITAKAAAALLGVDEKTLTHLVVSGRVRTVSLGRQRRFTERDLRAFLESGVAGRSGLGPLVEPRFSTMDRPRNRRRAK